jgi:predicted CopG family antitoxin
MNNPTNNQSRTIKVSLEKYKELARMGTLEDSFDSVIGRLLGTYYHQKQKEQQQERTQEQAQESRKIHT